MAEEENKQAVSGVSQGSVKPKRKGLISKLSRAIFYTPKEEVEDYLIDQVIVPTIMNSIADILGDAIDYVFRGRPGGRSNRSKNTYGPSVQKDYGAYSKAPEAIRRAPGGMRGTDEVTFKSRAEAMDVLEELVNAVDRFERASVYNFYEAAKLPAPNGYMDQNFGWYDLSTAHVENYKGDWYIVMPKISEFPRE